MRIYVAGASTEVTRAERMIAALRTAGHEITVDWTVHVRAFMKASFAAQPEGDDRRHAADEDYRGVSTAQRVVLLVPCVPSLTQGAWWEGGIADALGIPIIASGAKKDRMRNIFLSRTTEVETDDEVLALLDEKDLLKRLRDQNEELNALRARIAHIETGIHGIVERLYEEPIGNEEREAVYAAMHKRILG